MDRQFLVKAVGVIVLCQLLPGNDIALATSTSCAQLDVEIERAKIQVKSLNNALNALSEVRGCDLDLEAINPDKRNKEKIAALSSEIAVLRDKVNTGNIASQHCVQEKNDALKKLRSHEKLKTSLAARNVEIEKLRPENAQLKLQNNLLASRVEELLLINNELQVALDDVQQQLTEQQNKMLEELSKATRCDSNENFKKPETARENNSVSVSEGEELVHTVAKDERLTLVSERYYGTRFEWYRIWRANKDILKDPDRLMPGTRLVIPAIK